MVRQSFEALFDRWLFASEQEQSELEPILKGRYREAASGSIAERILAVSFIYHTRDVAGFDLVIAALEDPVVEVAENAARVILGLLAHHYTLGNVRQDLEKFKASHDEYATIAQAALEFLPEEQNG
jgi:hypothetical protein